MEVPQFGGNNILLSSSLPKYKRQSNREASFFITHSTWLKMNSATTDRANWRARRGQQLASMGWGYFLALNEPFKGNRLNCCGEEKGPLVS